MLFSCDFYIQRWKVFCLCWLSKVLKCWGFYSFVCLVGFGYAGFTWLHRLFSSCSKQGLPSSCGVRASHRGGFSCCKTQALGHVRAVAVAPRLSNSLNSCGAWAWLLCSVWDLPRPRIEPVSPALAGRFFTSEPPQTALKCCFNEGLTQWLILLERVWS